MHGLLSFFRYVDYYRLEQPSDDIEFVLTATAKRIGALMKGNNCIFQMECIIMIIIMSINFNALLHIGGVFDRTRAAQHFLRKFREGQLGRLTLDTVTSDKI